MFLNNCLKVVGAAVTYFYGVFIEDFVVAVFLWEMLADQVQKFSSDVCLHVQDCPLKNNCLTSSVIYNANVTTESDAAGMNYIGLTEGTFKQRYTQHKLSFRNRNYSNSTELSKHIWTLQGQQHKLQN